MKSVWLWLLLASLAFCQEKAAEKCVVAGRVWNASTGEPVRKAQVTFQKLAQPGSTSVTYGAVTGQGGDFSVPDIEPGLYLLTVERTGFVRGLYGGRRPTPITLAAGQSLTDLDVRLTPQAVITGRVFDEDGDPVANAMIQALRASSVRGKRQLTGGNTARTNDLGEYRISEVVPGRYVVSATWQGTQWSGPSHNPAGDAHRAYAPTYYPSTADPATAVPLQAAAGGELQGINVTLTRVQTVTVRGKARMPGDAARRSLIMLAPRDVGGIAANHTATIQEDGSFEIRGVPPGFYTVVGEAWVEGTRYMAREPLTVGSENVDGVAVTLAAGMGILGRVRVDGAGTVDFSKVGVFLRPQAADVTTMGTPYSVMKADGSFVMENVGPDTYSVGVSGIPPAFYLKSIRMGQQELIDHPVDLTRGSTGTLEMVLSPGAGEISVVVLNAKKEAGAGAKVVLIPDSHREELYDSAAADQHGNATLRGVAPGSYRLYAWEDVDEGAWFDADFLKAFESQGKAVTIQENSREGVQLELIAAQ